MHACFYNRAAWLRPVRRVLLIALVASPATVLHASEAGTDGEESPAGQPVISRSDGLVMDAEAYRFHLQARNIDDLRNLGSSEQLLQDMALDLHSDLALAQQAEALGLHETPEVAARLAKVRRDLLVEAYMKKVASEVTYDDLKTLARDRYALHKEKMVSPERRRVAHILLRDPQDCACDERPPAVERANALHAALTAGERDFDEAAREFSQDVATASSGGELPEWIQPDGRTARAFEHAVFALGEVGDISEPVVTPFGVHLIRLLEVQAPQQIPFAQAEARFIEQIRKDKVASAQQQARSAAYPDPTSIDVDALRRIVEALQGARDQGEKDT